MTLNEELLLMFLEYDIEIDEDVNQFLLEIKEMQDVFLKSILAILLIDQLDIKSIKKYNKELKETTNNYYQHLNSKFEEFLLFFVSKKRKDFLLKMKKVFKNNSIWDNLTKGEVENVLKDKFVINQTINQWFMGMKLTQYKRLSNITVSLILRGAAEKEIKEAVKKSTVINFNQLKSLTETSAKKYSEDIKHLYFKKNRDLISSYLWVSVLDDRTTPICTSLAFREYDENFEPVNHSLEFPGFPPIHFHCRSNVVPILKEREDLNEFRENQIPSSILKRFSSEIPSEEWLNKNA